MTNTKKILQKKISEPSVHAAENTFGFRLAFALAMRKISQAELAKLCGIHPSNISQYLTKNTVPRMNNLKLLAENLHVSEKWLTGEGKPSDIDRRENFDTLPPDEQKLLNYYTSLTPEQKVFVVKMIEVYCNSLS